jgi:hypothetical protein
MACIYSERTISDIFSPQDASWQDNIHHNFPLRMHARAVRTVETPSLKLGAHEDDVTTTFILLGLEWLMMNYDLGTEGES